MNVINISPTSKRRLKEMIKKLIPDTNFVRITKSGMTILRKHRFSLKRIKIPITDLCISELPKILSEKAKSKNMGNHYNKLFNEHIIYILNLRFYSNNFDIVEYLWDNYKKIYLEIPVILKLVEHRRFLPQPAFNAINGMFQILKVLKQDSLIKNKLRKKIIKIFSKQTLPNIADVFNFKLRRSLLGMSVC